MLTLIALGSVLSNVIILSLLEEMIVEFGTACILNTPSGLFTSDGRNAVKVTIPF
jgi:hypothetical protein